MSTQRLRGLRRLGPWVLAAQVACTTPAGALREDGSRCDNTASAACRQNPANCVALTGKETAATVGIAVASLSATLKVLDNLTRLSIEQALSECADLARSEVLLRYASTFRASTPDASECGTFTVDANGQRVTWAMRLGTEMHQVASSCAGEKLGKLRPGGFSLEPRYRYDRGTGRWKYVSPEEEQTLADYGNLGELRGSLKPDVVLHSGNPIDLLAIYDFKFPCTMPLDMKEVPDWPEYPEGHPYEGQSQGDMYRKLLGLNTVGRLVARIIPRWGVIR